MSAPNSPNHPSDTFAELAHLYVRMYSRIADGAHVVIMTIAPDGNAVKLQIASRSGDCHESKRLKEAEFIKFKSAHTSTAGLSWATFFELIQKCFVDHSMEFTAGELRLNVKHERHTDAMPMAPFSVTYSIPVQKCEDYTSEWAINMMSYIGLRTGDKKEQEKIDGIAKEAKELEDEAVLVDRECGLLEETVKALEKEIGKLHRETDELGELLARESSTPNWKSVVELAPLDRVIVRAFNPKSLQDAEQAEYNKRLLRQIKNNWLKRMPKLRVAQGDLSPGSSCLNLSSAASSTSNSSFTSSSNPKPPESPSMGRRYSVATLRSSDALVEDPDSPGDSLSSSEKKLIELLEKVDLWEFSPSDFDEVSKRCEPRRHGVLFYLSFLAFQRFGLMSAFNLSEQKVLDWLSAVEAGYRREVPYHNHHHAAMTLHSAMYILLNGDLNNAACRCLPDFGILGLLMACIVSAYDHPGISNAALNATQSYSSCVYGRQSITQSHSVAAALELMKTQRFDFLDAFSPQKKHDLITLIQHLVLSTDLARHESFMTFVLDRGDLMAPLVGIQGNQQSLPKDTLSGSQQDKSSQAAPDPSSAIPEPLLDDATAVLSLVIKAADVAFATKNTYQYREASKAYYAELKNDVTALETFGVTASMPANEVVQLNLLAHVVSPLYSIIADYCPAMRFVGDEISSNRQLWRS